MRCDKLYFVKCGHEINDDCAVCGEIRGLERALHIHRQRKNGTCYRTVSSLTKCTECDMLESEIQKIRGEKK